MIAPSGIGQRDRHEIVERRRGRQRPGLPGGQSGFLRRRGSLLAVHNIVGDPAEGVERPRIARRLAGGASLLAR